MVALMVGLGISPVGRRTAHDRPHIHLVFGRGAFDGYYYGNLSPVALGLASIHFCNIFGGIFARDSTACEKVFEK